MPRTVLAGALSVGLVLFLSLPAGAQTDKEIENWLRQSFEKKLVRVHASAAPELWDAKLPKEDQAFFDANTRLYLRVDKIRWRQQKMRVDGRRVVFYQDLREQVAQTEAPNERYEFLWKGTAADNRSLRGSVRRVLEETNPELIDWSGYWPPTVDYIPFGKKKPDEPAREVAPGIFTTGSDIVSPECQACPTPRFQLGLRRDSAAGAVTIVVLITESGRVAGMRVVESNWNSFKEACLVALSRWRFSPGSREGKPIRIVMHIENKVVVTVP